MRGAWIAVVVLSVALAGCSGGKDEDAASDGAEDEMAGGPGGNATALQAVIHVSQNGTALVPTNGTFGVDLGMAVTFDGSNSTGAILEYAWDFGDNATGADRIMEHTFAVVGLYNVSLTVAAAGNLTHATTIVVNVTGVAAGAFLAKQSTPFEGSLPLMNPNACMTQDVDCQDIAIPVLAEINGTPALAIHVWVNVTATGSPGSALQVFWRSPEGTNLAQTGAEGTEHHLEFSGDMAAGEYVVRVRLFLGADVEFQGAAEVTYVTV